MPHYRQCPSPDESVSCNQCEEAQASLPPPTHGPPVQQTPARPAEAIGVLSPLAPAHRAPLIPSWAGGWQLQAVQLLDPASQHPWCWASKVGGRESLHGEDLLVRNEQRTGELGRTLTVTLVRGPSFHGPFWRQEYLVGTAEASGVRD